MKRFFTIYLLFFVALCGSFAESQNDSVSASPGLRISIRTGSGFILRHHSEMAVYANHHFQMFEASVAYKTFGEQSWNSRYNYPWFGMSMYYSDLGASPYLGYAAAVYPYSEITFLGNQDFCLNGRAGLGIGYISKPFDRFDNYKNTAIGSHLNAAILLEMNLTGRIYQNIDFSGSLSFFHFSNGGTEMPNYGINVPSVMVGLNYHLRPSPPVIEPIERVTVVRKPEFTVAAYVGFKEIFPVDGPLYLVYNTTIDFTYPVLRILKCGLGSDVVYDKSDRIILEDHDIIINNNLETIKLGLHVTTSVEMGKMSGVAQFGRYVHQLDKSDGEYYDKVAVFYNIYRNFMLSVTLKTHFAKADYIGIGCAYRIKL
ncbi:MAG: acyloxyacyl hydrolase [Bacteroidales bacterium]|nr:acyloxyacyl hydrolase [Bacteroidales bacterium]